MLSLHQCRSTIHHLCDAVMVTYTTNNGTDITDLEPEFLPFTDTTIVTVLPFVAFEFPRNVTVNEVFRPLRTRLIDRDCR